MTRDLGLSKENSEVLASRLRDRNFLKPGTKIAFYRKREDVLPRIFSISDEFVFCNDIEGLSMHMGLKSYDYKE